jgi:cation diffusion facilitator family transporter
MSDCGCKPKAVETAAERRVLWIALALNAAMFVVETTGGVLGQSTGLLADGLDMLADASAYAVALLAIGRSATFKAGAATLSGAALLVLGLGLLAEVVRRGVSGAEPEGAVMIAIATLALAVNWAVLRLLARVRDGEVHLRAVWIFTRADVVANAAVILSGLLVMATRLRWLDILVGAGISVYVVREAFEILGEAREARARLSYRPPRPRSRRGGQPGESRRLAE